MNESDTEFVHEDTPFGMKHKPKKKTEQSTLMYFIKKLEKVPIKPIEGKKTFSLGFFKNIEFKMYLIDGQYWGLRLTLEDIYPNIRDRFGVLKEEYIEEFNCFWLEENIDYIEVKRNWFYQKFPNVVKKDVGRNLILLNVEGLIKLLSRSSKMKICLFWLIKKFIENSLYKVRIKEIDSILDEAKAYIKKSKKILTSVSKLLEIIVLYENKIIGHKGFEWILDYKIKFKGKQEDFHPIIAIRLTDIWAEGKQNLTLLNKTRNKGKLVCHYCRKEIHENEKTILEHLHYNKGFSNIFSSDYAVIIHKKCDKKKVKN